ncbi:MAG: PilN domain-containing protein [Armatimonadota bacterium]
MSQKPQAAQLLIEWDREWVRVHFVESSTTKEGTSLSEIDGVNGKTAILLMSRRLILQRSIALPDAQKEDVLVALKMKLADVFPIPASELAFDFIPTTERNDQGRICNVFAARNADVDEIIEICSKANITIHQIVPAQALTIKVAEQNAVSNGIFVERFGDFVNLDVFHYGDLVSSKLVSLDLLDNEIARMKALTGDSTKMFAYNVNLDGQEQKLASPYINDYFKSGLTLDLEPEDYRSARTEKIRKTRHKNCYMMFLVGLAIAAFVGNDYSERMSEMAKQELKYKKQSKTALTQTENDEAKAKKQQPAADQLTKAFLPAQKSSDILKAISILLPTDTWLTGVTFERGRTIQIRGTSKSPTLVSNFVSGLTKQKRFRDVRLMYANGGDIQGIPTVQFSINAFPVGNLPILETGKKKK